MIEFAMTYRVKSSGYNAKVAISKYIETVYQLTAPVKRGEDWYQNIDTRSLQYLQDTRDHSKDLILYIRTYESSAPKTIWKEVSFIKLWLESNDIEIKKSQFRMIRTSLPHNRVISEEDEFSHEIARRCMSHMHQPLRSITLMLMSSGMRIGELLQLEITDLDLESSPVTVTIQSETTKTKTARLTFISSEAKDEVIEWLLIRETYMITARKKNYHSLPWNDNPSPKLFPFTSPTIIGMWRVMLRKADLFRVDDQTHHLTIHPHSLRKFFISQLKAAGMPADHVEHIAGHSGYLSGSYRRYSDQELRDSYLKYEYAVSLSSPDMQVRAELESQSEILRSVLSESARNRLELDRRGEQLDRLLKAAEIAERLEKE